MEFNIVSRRTETAYKAEEADECAQHHEVRGCASTVNAAVVQLKFAFLSGETCHTCASATESVEASNGTDDETDPSLRREAFRMKSNGAKRNGNSQRA